jgi:hypothetical protein
MPVYKLMNEMPYEELSKWMQYLESRPVGWRDDDRTFKLLQAQGFKGKPGSVFISLAKIYNATAKSDPLKGLGSSMIFSKMLSAKGGDKLEALSGIK